MALTDLCYRCPACGRDPMRGKGDRAWCLGCGTRIARRRGRLFVTNKSQESHEINACKLVLDIDLHEEYIRGTFRPDVDFRRSARALVSWRTEERAIRYKGVLRGFAETMGDPTPGTVSARRDEVRIETPVTGREAWSYLELGALQASSSSLQLSLAGGRFVQFQFAGDSPRRWEEMLRALVRDAHRRAGRGQVLEFQPRIETVDARPAGRS